MTNKGGRKSRTGIITWKVRLFAVTGAMISVFFYMAAFIPERADTLGGGYSQTEHGGTDQNGNTVAGAARPANTPAGINISTTDFARGTCNHCHGLHGSYDGVSHTNMDYVLFDPGGAATNRFCYACHTTSIPTGGTYIAANRSFMGQAVYDVSSHGTSANMLWPGASPVGAGAGPAARLAGDQNKCVNCHNPHGRTFTHAGETASSAQKTFAASNPMLHLLFRNEEALCAACHDGTPAAKNIWGDFGLGTGNGGTAGSFNSHPTNRYSVANDRTPSVHTATETKALTAGTRHAECQDCHNPHQASAGTHTIGGNSSKASNVLNGAYGVTVTNTNTNWATPTAAWFTVKQIVAGTDDEYQLCFRCHTAYSSGWPTGDTDIAQEFNGYNLSYHWVEGSATASVPTRTTPPAAASYVGGFTYNEKMQCSDCHQTSSASTAKGPHGSANKYILRAPYVCSNTAAATGQAGTNTHLCFLCHAWNTYGRAGTCTAGTCSAFTNGNNLHQYGSHNNPGGGKLYTCCMCHVNKPHGWKRIHMIGLRSEAGAGNYVTNINYLTAYTHVAGNYVKGNCSTTGLAPCSGGH